MCFLLFCPVLSCPVLSCPVLSSHVLPVNDHGVRADLVVDVIDRVREILGQLQHLDIREFPPVEDGGTSFLVTVEIQNLGRGW